MYKKTLLICCLLMAVMASRAQITMTIQVPPMGVLVKNQLWNMLLVNTNNNGILVRVSLVLLDEKTNQPVLTAETIPILLNKGARQLQAKDLAPIQYTYLSPAFNADQDPNGLLPVGTYQACYTLIGLEKAAIPMAENCIQVNVDPLSPPLLNTPADEGSIYTSYPQFTWLPPTPAGIFNDLSFDLILVEVLSGQGKADAIQQNIPIYSAGFLKNLYMNYPSSYRALDTSHLYAWRIVALNNGLPTAMSDIWTFRVIVPDKPTLKKEGDVFIELKRDLSPSLASSGPILKVTYENFTADTSCRYTITSLGDPGNPVVQQGQLPLGRGRNFLQVPLQNSGGYASKKAYLFSLVNSRKESWTVKFTKSNN
jgi:hypothetical protein